MRLALVKLSALGDVIHTLPLARALRRAYPDAELSWLVEAREAAALRDHPDLDHVIPVDTRGWRRRLGPSGAGSLWAELRDLRARLRARRFEVAVDVQGLFKSGVITRLTGAPLRIGFGAARCKERLSALFTTRHVIPAPSVTHVVDQNLALLGALGIVPGAPEFLIPPRPEAQRRMDEFLTEAGWKPGDRLVALNPGAGQPGKQWEPERYAAVGERLGAEAGARVLLLWGPSESHLARQIALGIRGPGSAAARPLLAPPTDLDELAALLRRAHLMVAGDTGPLHLAAALGTPALGLFGPTSAARNGPYGPRCLALQSPDATMAGLTPPTVVAAAIALLEGSGAR
jgi:lipopolysaccharide heptosyltransferase I